MPQPGPSWMLVVTIPGRGPQPHRRSVVDLVMDVKDTPAKLTVSRARAHVNQSIETEASVDGDPVVVLYLTVIPTSRPPYDAITRESLSPVARAVLQPGTYVSVLVDPLDPNRLTFDLPG